MIMDGVMSDTTMLLDEMEQLKSEDKSQLREPCYGHNSDSIGICLVGRDEFNREQFYSLKQLIEELELRYDLIEVTGHYRYSSKLP